MENNEYKGTWIFAEQEYRKLNSVVFELIAKARELQVHSREPITAVVLGHGISHTADTLFEYGADQVILADDPSLALYSPRLYEKALTQLADKYKPSVFLFAATELGRDLAPRVMVSLHTGLTADAIDLCYDEDDVFCQTTPGYGGKIMAHICIPDARTQMVTVHPHICAPLQPVSGAAGILINESISVETDSGYEVLSEYTEKSNFPSLSDSSVIISVGRGVSSEADLAMFRELAGLCKAQLASSRPLVDSGWMPHELQIGQSGASVSPEFILNTAISGSTQYTLGMEGSKFIVSVNHDPGAPIFGLSDCAVTADYRQFIPALIDEIKRRSSL